MVPVNGPGLRWEWRAQGLSYSYRKTGWVSISNFSSVSNSPLALSAWAHCSCTARKATSQDHLVLPWNSTGKIHSLHVSSYTLPAFALLTTTLASSHTGPAWLWAAFLLHTRAGSKCCMIRVTGMILLTNKPLFHRCQSRGNIFPT